MNALDVAVVEHAVEAGVAVTVIGDPWQSLYEFRGSTPRRVAEVLKTHPFRQIDMPGEHRYTTPEMTDLAGALFRNEPFSVIEAREGDSFNIVLAHDWAALWAETRIPLVPAGTSSRLDRGRLSSCFTLLLNAVLLDRFGVEAGGTREAERSLQVADAKDRLRPVLDTLYDSSQTADDVWASLRDSFQPAGSRPWKDAGKLAQACMSQLVSVSREDGGALLGLSVHQAKGLEWDRVLFLDSELSTDPNVFNRLDINQLSHRNVYVALTRAREAIRVAHVVPDKYAAKRSPIEHVRRNAA